MKFYAIGGYNEIGKNMSAVEIGNEVVIIDMGIQVDKILQFEGEEYRETSTKKLISIGALPNDSILHGKKVRAIVLGHAHLDHCEAIPRLAEAYKCPIIGTQYTCEVVKKLLRDEEMPQLKKYVHPVSTGHTTPISKEFEVELVHMTHSIPQTALVALHTREGAVVYLNDYKLDNTPTLEEKPDYRRIKQLGREGVKLLVIESVRASEAGRTPSEAIARLMVKDAIERSYRENSCVVITTYSSHIARLKTIIEANRGERKIAMLGRSLLEYVDPAKEMGLLDTKDVELFAKKRKGVGVALEKIKQKPGEWLIITTGNQGEPNSVLSRIARKEYKFEFKKEDQVIFSSEIIPNPINRANRYSLERSLREQGARIFTDVHVSGHARREDHRDMIRFLNPQFIFPSHGETEKLASFATLAQEEGYSLGKTVQVLTDGAFVEVR